MADTIHFKIRRQDTPDSTPYWQEFQIPYKAKHNVVSALMAIRETPVTTGGERVDPVMWECNCMEEVCGACAMVINGVPRQSCSTLVDSLTQPIVLEPLTKFPVVRDLLIDRQQMFDDLRKVKAWVDIDGAYDIHERSPRISPQEHEVNYAYSTCMTCGCCMESCPQYGPSYDFVGPAPLGQVRLMNAHPTGRYFREERLHAIMGEGGISDCGNAQNCVRVCPKEIPLTTGIAELGRQVTVQLLKDVVGK
jgi:succinate dehydrogenase / fumarate reductase, iron-sulfur subunit